jgi:Ca-activated chloride channel family protein
VPRRADGPVGVVVVLAILLAACVPLRADSVREMLQEGNRLYGSEQYTDAINKYNEVLIERPQAPEPKFNKANGYYRLDDLGEAMDLYREAAAESKDMSLVAKAKYNLGNCFFQQGSKQRDSDLQKALEDMKTSITYWRQVLDIDPKNEKAARNIEVARLTIKDILDQLKQQQKDQQQDPNQPSQQQPDQGQPQNQTQPPQDPNQAQDPNQPQDPNDQMEEQQRQQKVVPDATAQEIIDTEQRQKQERQIQQRARYREVEKDW